MQHDRYEWKVYRIGLEAAEKKLNEVTAYGLEEVFSVQVAQGPDGTPEMVIVARQHLEVKRRYEESLERGKAARAARAQGAETSVQEPRKNMTRGRREMNDTGGF
ncbi:hypothetical protein [Sorangium sp. So ce233]|uniref:hypothetical protein n=1 Tax=Sorangium sp. So ce233 TaxID=3133290 RepID=UPI003F6048EA